MEKQAGVVVVLNSGDQGVKVPLKTNTPCSLGSSINATIRVAVNNDNLRDVHCVINVNAKGFAVLVNKSKFHPVVLNGKSLLNEKVLINNDIFEVCGRKFQYVNSRMTEEKAKLYKKETGALFLPTPVKSRATESATSVKAFATPRRIIAKKKSMSTSKPSKKISPRGSKSATKPAAVNYSPVQTRRSLFKGKISASTSKIPVKSTILPRMTKTTSTPKIINSGASVSTKSKTPCVTPKNETNDESFLQNESLCKSVKKSGRRSSLRRFVTIRGGRKRTINLSFDSTSAEEQTPSKTNISVETTPFNVSKRKSIRSSVRGSTIQLKHTSLDNAEAELLTPHLREAATPLTHASEFNRSKRKSVKSSAKSGANSTLDCVEAPPQTPVLKCEVESSSTKSSRKSNIRPKLSTPHVKVEEETPIAVTDASLNFNDTSKRGSVRNSSRNSTIPLNNASFDEVESQPQTSHFKDDEESLAAVADVNVSKRRSVRNSLRSSLQNASSSDVEDLKMDEGTSETERDATFNISKRKSLGTSLRSSVIASKEDSLDEDDPHLKTSHLQDEEETSAVTINAPQEFNISRRKSGRNSLRSSTSASEENSLDEDDPQLQTPHLEDEGETSVVTTDATQEFNTSTRKSVRNSLRSSTIAAKESSFDDDDEPQLQTPHLQNEEETSAVTINAAQEFNSSKRKSVRNSRRSSTIAAKESSFDDEPQLQTSHLQNDEETSAVMSNSTQEFNSSRRKSVRNSMLSSTITSKESSFDDDDEPQLQTPHLQNDEETSEVISNSTQEFNSSKRKSVRNSMRSNTIASKESSFDDDDEPQLQTPHLQNDQETSAVMSNSTQEFNSSKCKSVRNSMRSSSIASKESSFDDDDEPQLQTPHLQNDEETSEVMSNATQEFNSSKRKSVRNSMRRSTIAAKESSFDDDESQLQTPHLQNDEETPAVTADATEEFNTSKRKSVRNSLRSSTIVSKESSFDDDDELQLQISHLKDDDETEDISGDDAEAQPLTLHLKSDEATSAAMMDSTLEFNISMRKSVRSSLRSRTSIENARPNDVDTLSRTPQKMDDQETDTLEVNISVRRSIGSSLRHSTNATAGDVENEAKSSRTNRVRAKSLAAQTTSYLKDGKTLATTLRNSKVRPKSLAGLKPKSSKKRYSLQTAPFLNEHMVEGDAEEEEEADVTTPVMTHNISKHCLSAPRIHHMRKSRLDDAVNESLHMDDSMLETPVIHESSRRSLAKKSTAKLQESLRLISPDTSLDMEEMQKTTPDVESGSRRFSGEEILGTPLKAGEGHASFKSARKLSNMKVSITSTPKEPAPCRSAKRQLSSSLDELNMSKTKILKEDDQSGTDENLDKHDASLSVVQRARKSMSVNASSKLHDESSLLESTVASSIVYETNLSKTKVRTPLTEKKELQKAPSSSENIKTPKSDLSNISGIGTLYTTPEAHSSKSEEVEIAELTNADSSTNQGKRSQTQTPKHQKSPENDLRNVRGLRRLMQTPKEIKSPENDLRDVRGLRKLMGTPKEVKSPENDLRNVRGLRKLMQTPKPTKSPNNDLSNVEDLKRLMRTPKEIKSPENDLRDVRGLRTLMQTPKVIKSPENDLRNVAGLRRLMQTPKGQKSPTNDLRDVSGVQTLLRTPKSPENDLRNVSGLGVLLQTPQEQKSSTRDARRRRHEKSPENDLRDVGGLRRLMQTPKEVKSPKNDLSNVSGVKILLREKGEPSNDLRNVSGVKDLFEREEESAFDRLLQKKKVVTYKRKISWSETKNKGIVLDSKSPSATVTPRVQEWVSQQVLLSKETLEHESGETIEDSEEPPSKKRVVRKARAAADFLDPVVITTTTRSTRQRKQVVEESNKEETKTVRTTRRNAKQIQEQNEVDNIEVTPAKTGRRKRQQVALDSVESTKTEAESAKKTRRQNKKETDEKPSDTPIKQQKQTRSRKRTESQNEHEQEELVHASVERQRPTRGRKQNNSKPAGKETEKPLDNSKALETQQEDTPVKQKQTRSRRQNNSKQTASESKESLVNAATSEEQQEESSVKKKQTRSRKQNNSKQTENQNKKVTFDADVSGTQQEEKQTRSRKRNDKKETASEETAGETDSQEIVHKSPKTKRQNRNKKDVSDTEESVVTVEKTKRTRARTAAKETASVLNAGSKDAIVEPLERSTKDAVNEKAETKRVTRRARKIVVEDQPSPLRRSARTRK